MAKNKYPLIFVHGMAFADLIPGLNGHYDSFWKEHIARIVSLEDR